MLHLMVSTDAGCSYHRQQSAETVEELQPAIDQAAEDRFRWTVEDDKGNFVAVTPIFEQIHSIMRQIREEE